MHHLQLVTRRLRDTEIIQLEGGLDADNFANLANRLTTQLRASRQSGAVPRFILDCSAVSYIGSAELKALQDLAQSARAHGGDIKCAHLGATIEHVANLIANGDPLDCHPDVTAALDAFQHAQVAA